MQIAIRLADRKYLDFLWAALAAVVLGALLSKWFWVLAAPATPALPVMVEQAGGNDAEKIFGMPPVSGNGAAATILPNVRLIGVFTGKHAFAILEVGGKQMAVVLGGEVAPGTKLEEVAADHVTLSNHGLRQRVDMPVSTATSGIVKVAEAGRAALPAAAPPAAGLPEFDVAGAVAHMDQMPPDQREGLRQLLLKGIQR